MKQKIHVVFLGKPQWEAGWPYLGYNNDTFIATTLTYLKEHYSHVEFSVDSMIVSNDHNAVEANQNLIIQSDACIFFTIGHYGDPGLIESALKLIRLKRIPTLLANFVYMGDHTFLKIYTTIKNEDLPLIAVSSQKIEDFEEKFTILVKLLEMKGKRALVYATDDPNIDWNRILELQNPELDKIIVNHPEFFQKIKSIQENGSTFFTDHGGIDQAHQWRKDEELYKKTLKEIFGIEMIRENPEEIMIYYDKVSKGDAKIVARKWIQNASKVIPSEKTILNAAKLYLALKKMLTDHKCDIFAPDCGTMLLTGRLPAYPCMAFLELVNDQKYGVCESDMDCLTSYLFGLTLTNRPGFVSNHSFDTTRNHITYLHCICSNKLYGQEGESSQYEIRYHGETAILGASPSVLFPVGEFLTTIKISVFERKIAIRTGKIIDNIKDEKGCVTKVLVESNVDKILKNYEWNAFGWHRVSFVGDWRETFVIGAKLLGLSIIEEDK